MEIVISSSGQIRCIYSDAVPLAGLGNISITRASHVEPDSFGQWLADLSPSGGPMLGPFAVRADALTAEINWLRSNWLLKPDCLTSST